MRSDPEVHGLDGVAAGDRSPIWGSIEAFLPAGTDVIAVFGDARFDFTTGGVLVVTSDRLVFFRKQVLTEVAPPKASVLFRDILEVKPRRRDIQIQVERTYHLVGSRDQDGLMVALERSIGERPEIPDSPQRIEIVPASGEDGIGGPAGRSPTPVEDDPSEFTELFIPLVVAGLRVSMELPVVLVVGPRGVGLNQADARVLLPYTDLRSVTVGGAGLQVEQRGGGMVGGGFGLAGFAIGAASAAIYNKLTTRTNATIETTLKLEGRGFEVVLLTDRILPERLDLAMAGVRARLSAIASEPPETPSLVGQLRDLQKLFEAGVLSDAEFTAAKARVLGIE